MKKIYISLYFIALCLISLGQNPEKEVTVFDRSQPPEPGPVPKVVVGSYDSFILPNGLEVFVVEDKESSRVSFQLSFLKNGPIAEGENAGIGQVTAELMENGTRNRSASQVEDEIDYMAASINSYDGGVFASSLKKYQDQLLEIMADMLLNPSMPEDKLTKIKKRTISGLLADAENPNVIANKVVRTANYSSSHPYGEMANPTSVTTITREMCIEHYQKYYKPNSAYLVMVGNIDLEEAKAVAETHFGGWEKQGKNEDITMPDVPAVDQTKVLLVDRPESKQSVINITYPVDLKPGSQEAITASVMNSILGGGSARLFDNLREDKGYTYGAYSSLSSDEYVGTFNASASVRNEVTKESVQEFINEMERIVNEPVPEEELEFTLNKVGGSFARSLESPQTVARFAINTARYDLPPDYYQTYLEKLRSITVDDIQASAKKYIRPENANIVVVGKGEEIKEGLTGFGEIIDYRKDGSAIEKVNLEDISIENTTAKEIIERYIQAVGGADKVRQINSLIISCSSQMGEFNMVRKGATKATNSLINGDERVFQIILNGEEANGYGRQGRMNLDLATITKLKYTTRIHEEVFYGSPNWKFKFKLKDVAEVDGKACYKVFVTAPSGDRMTKYYDAATGLLVQEVSPFKGTVSYGNYKEVEGVMFPHSYEVKKSRLYGSFSAVVTKIEINPEVSDLFFRVF